VGNIDPELVKRTARLAGLALPEAGEAAMVSEFERILGAFRRLEEVDITEVIPLYSPQEGRTRPREDTERPGAAEAERESLLERAPDREGDFFGVPRTLGGEQ
jgi:aspartyl-tRNA(Asn)/glutamyl-tRNA(Gln) amidotransferase subunit C